MDDIIAYVTENPIIAGGVAGGVVLLVILILLAGRGGAKKRDAAPARSAPAPAPAAEPARAAAPEPAPAAAPAAPVGDDPAEHVRAAAVGRGQEAAPEAVAAVLSHYKPPATVLWVDDRPESVAHEAAALRALGAHVDQVTTNADALARLKDHAYDVVISDIDRQASEGGKAGFYLPEQIKDQTGQERRVVFYVGVVTQRLIGGVHPATNSPVELLQLVQKT